jgi:hypothetical protein
MNYTQVKVMREIFPKGCGQLTNQYQTSWIPSSFAFVGNRLRLKENDEWTDGWIVEEVFQTVEDRSDERLWYE